ncbi:TlpA disulfide reductase family protein [Acuticoccus mangrovi]|uniref:TlpA family protein disulfide reductase n=1 Tax=Acuticoccus mangrovi TaxID=2796142 RepID=A0A934INV3_9HYPH|nr:TlpA disulfide reductase family protein [Acuticoccus mangrovi]MBJ3775896.1 TlpA family protein disulfide reductase [Acuticoccus mangrovi]
MPAVQLGPLLFAGDRLAAVVGVIGFLAAAALLSALLDRRLAGWATTALLVGVVAARIGHVALHAATFATEPLRALMVWQGGFSLPAGLLGVALYTLLAQRTTRARLGAVAAVGGGLLAWTGAAVFVAPQPIAAPTMPITTLGDAPLRIADLAGRPVVVNLWATWCPPCRREMPLLTEAAAARTDVGFVLANQGEGASAVRAFLAAAGLPAAHVAIDRFRTLSRHYGVKGYPTTLFLNPDGTLRAVHVGEISREALGAALGDPAPARRTEASS